MDIERSEDFSVFSLATTLLRSRWRIARWSLGIGVLAALTVINKPKTYLATTSFIPQGSDEARSSLASAAAQFGVSVPSSGQSLTPEFYATLIKSRVLLSQVARDTFTVAELGGRRVTFYDLFKVQGDSPDERLNAAVHSLDMLVNVTTTATTGVVAVTALTAWPSVSLRIAQDILNGVNDFNLHSRQSQAGQERKFIEDRRAVAADDLRQAEDRMSAFLQQNRQFAGSPNLGFQRDRLQQEVVMNQGVYTSLSQAYEDARLREVRDTPVITVFEPPFVQTEPRGRVVRVLVGLVAGAIIGTLLSLLSAVMTRRKLRGDAEIDEFIGTVTELRGNVFARVPWIGDRARR